ncbi:MAG: tetratricopeptide repeat protein [Candidatus Aenigmatarchaeota archaeon]
MAQLSIDDNFSAYHGSFDIRRDTYAVAVCVEGSIVNGFVRGLDSTSLRCALSSVTSALEDRYLDDVVGRATNEHIGLYILHQLLLHPLSLVRIVGDGHGIEVYPTDISANYPTRLLYERARSLLYRDKPAEAIKIVSQSIDSDNTFAPAYNLRGRCHRTTGQWHAALPDFEKAISLDPNFGEAYRNAGNALYYLGRTDEMIDAFTKAVELMPTSALAINNRGFAHQRLQEWELALADHTRALELDYNYAEAHTDMAAALKALGRAEEAIEYESLAQELHVTGRDTYATKLFY